MFKRKEGDAGCLLVDMAKLFAATQASSERTAQERENLVKALDAVQDGLERAALNLAPAIGPIQTLKNKTDFEFDDNIRILTMELQTLGVSSNIVDEVESLCCRHLAKRELQVKPLHGHGQANPKLIGSC